MPTAAVVTVLSELVCYLVLSASDRAACETFGYIPYRLASVGKSYIGLRERVQDAIVRYKQFFNGPYMIVKITFTARGIAHYSVASAGPQHAFSSMLSKQVYWPRSRTEVTEDYKVWHFHGDLPFKVGDELCNPSIIVIGVVAKIYVNRTPIPIVTDVMRMSPVTGSWLSRNIWLGTALRLVDITAAKKNELSGRLLKRKSF